MVLDGLHDVVYRPELTTFTDAGGEGGQGHNLDRAGHEEECESLNEELHHRGVESGWMVI